MAIFMSTNPNYYNTLGATVDETANIVAGFLKNNPAPSTEDIKNLYSAIPLTKWGNATAALISSGVSPDIVHSGSTGAANSKFNWVKDGLTLLAAVGAGYHGTKRNNSIFWGSVWFLGGLTFPVLSTIFSWGQGFGKRK